MKMLPGRIILRGPAILLVVALSAAGCSTTMPRFVEGPVVWDVDDRANIDPPSETEFYRLQHHFVNFFDRRIRNGLDPLLAAPALDVNRLGGVPTSSWYVNRSEDLRPEDLVRGAGGDLDSPEEHFPWTLTRVKVGGQNPGFLFRDSSGQRFLLKLDKPGTPTIATAAGAVANRLFWALGYHVPDDRVVFFRRQDLLLSDAAIERGISGAAVDAILESHATHLGDGRWRGLVSRFLGGRPVGGYSYRGTRSDDPNDRIPHERRRSLRALRVFGAWLNHVDTKIDNTLDLYTERDGRHYLQHYLVDFDGCLGGYWAARHEARIGWAYDLDLGQFFSSIPKLGLDRRPYEGMNEAVHPEIGLFDAKNYDPARWRSNYVNDQILSANPADLYWAGQKLRWITPLHIAAAVKAARFEDPEAERVLTDILVERWRKTLRWSLTQVSPVEGLDPVATSGDGFRVDAVDALTEAGLDSDLTYCVRVLDLRGRERQKCHEDGFLPSVVVDSATVEGQDYVVVEWIASTPEGRRLPPTSAHYRRVGADGSHRLRSSGGSDDQWVLLGVLRDGE